MSDTNRNRDGDRDEGATSADTGEVVEASEVDGLVPGKRNPLVTALVVIAVIAVALFVGKRIADNIVPDVPGVTLTDIHTIEDLRARFNQDQGAPRLVLFVSPT